MTRSSGTTHIDALEAFEADPDTKAIVMIGEIGGDAEERAAAYIKDHVTKPVVGYVAGFTAPEGKTMGHAGAIVSGSSGTAEAKKEALEAVGVKVGKTPSETAAADAGDPAGPDHRMQVVSCLFWSSAPHLLSSRPSPSPPSSLLLLSPPPIARVRTVAVVDRGLAGVLDLLGVR